MKRLIPSKKESNMKISTRILISLILSLSFLGGSIIAMTYFDTQKNARFFLEHYQKSAYAFHENELKTIMDLMRQTAMSIYNSQKAKGISDEKIKEAILEKLNDPRFFNDKSGYFLSINKTVRTYFCRPIKPWKEKTLSD